MRPTVPRKRCPEKSPRRCGGLTTPTWVRLAGSLRWDKTFGGNKTKRVLCSKSFGLKAAPISTQILCAGKKKCAITMFFLRQVSAGALRPSFGRDGRHLSGRRLPNSANPSEQGQVGIVKPWLHQRNPINFENLEGTWLKNQVASAGFWPTSVKEATSVAGSAARSPGISRDRGQSGSINSPTCCAKRGGAGKPFNLADLGRRSDRWTRTTSKLNGDAILARRSTCSADGRL